jgi:hypothetical protein
MTTSPPPFIPAAETNVIGPLRPQIMSFLDPAHRRVAVPTEPGGTQAALGDAEQLPVLDLPGGSQKPAQRLSGRAVVNGGR